MSWREELRLDGYGLGEADDIYDIHQNDAQG